MKLTREEFKQFSPAVRFQLLKEFGKCVKKVKVKTRRISVYRIFDFHAEVYENLSNGKLEKVELVSGKSASENSSVLEEPVVQYRTMRSILGGNKAIQKPISGDSDLVDLSRKGVKKSTLKSLAGYLGITMETMSGILHSSYRNIQRKDDTELLDVYKSEQAIEIAEVISKCLDVFKTKENTQQWLHSSLISLGHKKPIELLDTSFGIRMIFNVLNRLEHGVYS